MSTPEELSNTSPGGAEGSPWTVLHSRSLSDLDLLQADVVGSDSRDADLFLRFVRATSALAHDEDRLLAVVSDFTFMAFPQANHFALVVNKPGTEEMELLLARSRGGADTTVALSQTLVLKVMTDGISLLYSNSKEALAASDSIQLSRIQAAICAPLWSREHTFGVIQLDVRHPGKGMFGRKDVDRLALFSHYVALVLDNLRLYREQREALESTIHALIVSLSFKDPETAAHSERVKLVAVHLGRAMGLSGSDLDQLRVAAVLHDMGKQGVSDEVLFKPSRLTDEEREEMSRHAHLTQDILDRIRYPNALKNVPMIAAYHHEKMTGDGPYKIPAALIPIQSRIIAVADVFDALVSARAYKKPMPVAQVLVILEQGRDLEWDGQVVDTLVRELDAVLLKVYSKTRTLGITEHGEDGLKAA